MGKHRHTKDRMFISYTEHKMEWGGKKDPEKVPMSKLPFFCCSLSLTPFKNPVCSPDGIIFDIMSIIPYIKKYKKNPVTGEDLKISDLITLKFSKNENGEYQDPISFKVFTDHTHIVTIKTSGNVYSFDTVDKLNREAKYWQDLMTGEKFTPKDIITLNDPKNLENRTIKNFDYIRNNIQVELKDKGNDAFINKNEATKNILTKYQEKQKQEDLEQKKKDDEEIEQIRKQRKEELDKLEKGEQIPVADFIKSAIRNRDFVHQRETTSDVAVSVTSTASAVMREQASLEFRSLNETEIRKIIHDQVKNKQMKGYVNIITNIGEIQCMIHANFVPKTSENFLELCEKGYYNGIKFHRLVKDFMIQGGDPTGTGRGGESIFGYKFEDEFHAKIRHSKPGILSMANSGPNTNASQFFITLGECAWLDEQHNAFGEVIGNQLTLHKINTHPVNGEKPATPIIIEKIIIVENPFRQVIVKMQEQKREKLKEEKRKATEKEREHERWISNDDKFVLPKLAETEEKPKIKSAGLASMLTDPKNSNYDILPKEKHRKNFNFSDW
ncbi:hypothetical protein ABPG74_007524 [Tetrahymena malaccensis]